jgi:hypothetical protein
VNLSILLAQCYGCVNGVFSDLRDDWAAGTSAAEAVLWRKRRTEVRCCDSKDVAAKTLDMREDLRDAVRKPAQCGPMDPSNRRISVIARNLVTPRTKDTSVAGAGDVVPAAIRVT